MVYDNLVKMFQKLHLYQPLLLLITWNCGHENPVLYSAEITLLQKMLSYTLYSIPFGIRTIEATAEKGFLLNGKSIKLKVSDAFIAITDY